MALIRFLRAYGLNAKGEVKDIAGPAAMLLVDRGVAEYVDAEEPECAAVEPARKAVRRRPRKRRAGKPKAVSERSESNGGDGSHGHGDTAGG